MFPQNTAKLRKYIYGVACAALTVAAAYGVLSSAEMPIWTALIAAILGMAAANTDTTAPDPDTPSQD